MRMPEEGTVVQGLAFFPRSIRVTEVNPLAQTWMGTPPQAVKDSWSRDPEVLGLQLHEAHGGRVVVLRDFQPEPVGLVLDVAAERQSHGNDNQGEEVHQQNDQRQRSDIAKPIKPPAQPITANQSAG